MDSNRREFMKTLSGLTVGGLAALGAFENSLLAAQIAQESARIDYKQPEEVAEDEDFWFPIQQAYTSSPNIINLNNGGVSPHPLIVQEAVAHYTRYANEAPAYTMWQILDKGREPIRAKLAELAKCSAEEVAIVRNTTEALDIPIFGLDFKPGDEIVMTKQDYPNMVNAWKQREKRDGIKIVWLDFELPIENDGEFVQKFENAFSDKTKLVHITQMINWTGQIMPTRAIAKAAKKRGIEVLVDGAHTFAQFDFSVPDLECDYFGTSLHKWLSAPFGTGMIYVKKDKIKKLWPLFPNHIADSDDIRKFEGMGTRNIPAEMAIGHAIDFHNGIGIKRKEARLRYLKNYWANRAAKIPGVTIKTSLKPNYSCALALFSIKDVKPTEVAAILMDKFKVFVTSIEWENISGIRVTPHVYTKIAHLEKLLEGITYIAQNPPKKETK